MMKALEILSVRLIVLCLDCSNKEMGILKRKYQKFYGSEFY